MKKIRIECEGRATLPWQKLVAFQGDLKDLHIKEYEKGKDAILDLGFSEPISIWIHNKKNYILNGHQRLRVVQQMVEKEGYQCPPLPVNYVFAQSLKQAKKKVLSLTSQWGRMTGQGLYEYSQEAGISAKEVGAYRFPEIKYEKWKDEFFEDPEVEGEDTLPEAVPSVSKPGDLWTLAEQRLVCGDSTDDDAIARCLGTDRAQLIYTDPPYGVSYEQGKFTGNKVKKKFKEIANDDLRGFLRKVWDKLPVVEGASIYCWSAPLLPGAALMQSLVDSGWHLQSQIIWDKKRLVLGRADYQWRHEVCWYGYKGKGHRWCGDRDQTTIWEQKRDSTYSHPTQKPLELAERAVKNSTNEGDVVFDPFCGSGGTLLACDRLGRLGRAIELDPAYCDVILERFYLQTKKRPRPGRRGQVE